MRTLRSCYMDLQSILFLGCFRKREVLVLGSWLAVGMGRKPGSPIPRKAGYLGPYGTEK